MMKEFPMKRRIVTPEETKAVQDMVRTLKNTKQNSRQSETTFPIESKQSTTRQHMN